MSIYVYNTLTRCKEIFQPLNPSGKISMYVCGITPYDYCHLGHARCYFAYDLIKRYLEFKSYKILYVQNFTDIDDKIIDKAKKENTNYKNISEKFIKSYLEDLENLNIKKADIYPKVTEHIPEIIKLIQGLINKHFAYVVEGDVYFRVEKFKNYGKLSHRSSEEMLAGARIEANEKKQNPLDFALWKKSKDGEPFWESPWSKGRPGWHIECSAMSMKYLGETFDIHGGAIELSFPHHENEIAQAEAYTNKQFVRYWIHNGLVTVEGQKMSKSLGNFITIKELLNKYHPEVIRLFLLQTHYLNPLDFSFAELNKTKTAYLRLLETKQKINEKINNLSNLKTEEEFLNLNKPHITSHLITEAISLQEKFIKYMDDDFNSAKVIASVFEFIKVLNKNIATATEEEIIFAAKIYFSIMNVLGLLEINYSAKVNEKVIELFKKYFPTEKINSPEEALEKLINLRQELRRKKEFFQADEIRQELLNLNIILEDGKDGTKWKVE